MNFNEYQDMCAKYEKSIGTDWYYALGLTGEAGETAELIKKSYRTLPHNQPVVVSHLALELGDVLWYLARLAAHYGLKLETIATMNIAKLEARRGLEPRA